MKYIVRVVCVLLLFSSALPITLAKVERKIYIDPGHFQGDERTDIEIRTNLAVALRLRDLLDEDTIRGISGIAWKVRMSRDTAHSRKIDVKEGLDLDLLKHRALDANDFKADLFLSIHCNGNGGTGTETFWCDEGSEFVESQKFAKIVQKHMVERGEWRSRRMIEDNEYLGYHLAVLKDLTVPGCLNEIGFVDSDDVKKLESPYWQDRFAEAYRDAIFEYFNKQVPEYLAISVKSGWNVISLPGIPANSDPGSLIGRKARMTPRVERWSPEEKKRSAGSQVKGW